MRNRRAPDIDVLVVGAGIIGLSLARALARRGREPLVVEREAGIGRGISSRSSEVVHAGIYYPPGSLKARLCVEGRAALYAFCAEAGVPHARCGKIVVAANEGQAAQIGAVAARAQANGVHLDVLDRKGIKSLEPEADGALALYSPHTGVVDSHALMLALQGDAQAHGATFAFGAPLEGARCGDPIEAAFGGAEPFTASVGAMVIAAGLSAPRVASMIEGMAPGSAPRPRFAKGSYFSLARRAPFSRLVYPVPEPGGLGVHLTLDLAGRARFGPDVEWLDIAAESEIDYAVDPARAQRFYAAIRRYWPGLRDGELVADYSGVRPKIVGPGEGEADFMIQGSQAHGARGIVAL